MANPELGLIARLEVTDGKESDVVEFLEEARSMADDEPGTTTWMAGRIDESTIVLVDTFEDESAREAHDAGELSAAFGERMEELFEGPPEVEEFDLLEAKLP